MSVDPEVAPAGTDSLGRSRVAWSVLRAGLLGLGAAVAGAGLYAGVGIFTGREFGLIAWVMGAAVGFAVVVGNPQIAQGWVRVLSVLLTLFGLLLSSYLLLWLYDGQGFAPVSISVGEAAVELRDLIAEDPLELLFWGLALVTAFGVTRGESADDGDEPLAEPAPPDAGSLVRADVVLPLREAPASQAVQGSVPWQPNIDSEPSFADFAPAVQDLPTAHETPVPARVSARPVDRFVFSGAMSACGLLFLTVAVLTADDPETPVYFFPITVAVAMATLLFAATGLRMGLVADEGGITLYRGITTSRTSWSDLEDVVLEPRTEGMYVGLHRLVLVTRQRPRVVAGFMGRDRHGSPLPELRRTLLAMRQRYLATASPVPQTAAGVAPVDLGSSDPPRAVEPMDRVSLAAFVLSVPGIVIAAAPLALWGLARGGLGPRRGRGLAVAALSISALWVVGASAVLVGTGVVGQRSALDPSAPLAHAHQVFWDDLRPDSCVRVPNSDWDQAIVVDCRLPHHEEVMASTTLDGPTTWPGDEAVDAMSDEACQPVFEDYVGVAPDDSALDYYSITADENGWNEGEHTLICMVFDPSRHELSTILQGSAR